MTQQEIDNAKNTIAQSNKIIADFMGLEKCDRCTGECGLYKLGRGIYYKPEEIGYNTSWDWLMPVIEKIAHFKYPDDYNDYAYTRTFGMKDDNGLFMVRINRSSLFSKETLIEAAWFAVVDFVNWYNTQSK